MVVGSLKHLRHTGSNQPRDTIQRRNWSVSSVEVDVSQGGEHVGVVAVTVCVQELCSPQLLFVCCVRRTLWSHTCT